MKSNKNRGLTIAKSNYLERYRIKNDRKTPGPGHYTVKFMDKSSSTLL